MIDLAKNYEKIVKETEEIFLAKQHDYGSENIAQFGEVGVLVRLNDKMERLKNLVTNNNTPKNESLQDTLYDIINYAIIYSMILNDEWENVKHFKIMKV